MNFINAQSIGIARGNNQISISTPLQVENEIFYFWVRDRITSSTYIIKFNSKTLLVDTIIDGLGKSPNSPFYPTSFPYYAKGEDFVKFMDANGNVHSTPFQYYLSGYALLDKKKCLFIDEFPAEYKESGVRGLNRPLGYYIYDPSNFSLLYSGKLEVSAGIAHLNGVLYSANYWAVIINTGLMLQAVGRQYEKALGLPIFKELNDNSKAILIYNNNARLVNKQYIQAKEIFAQKQSNFFLSLSTEGIMSFWELNENSMQFDQSYKFDNSMNELIDYAFYKGHLYVLSKDREGGKVSLTRHNINTKERKSLDAQHSQYINVNNSGIYLFCHQPNNDSMIINNALKEKELFDLKVEDKIHFGGFMWYESVLTILDFEEFEIKRNDNIQSFQIKFSDSIKVIDATFIPCLLSNNQTQWISYSERKFERKDTVKFKGISISIGNTNYFFFPEKCILWERKSGKKFVSICNIQEALNKSFKLFLKQK